MNPYTLPDSTLEDLLLDDAPCGDATTFALGIGGQTGRLVFRARYEMTICGSEEARRMGELRGLRPLGTFAASGQVLPASAEILTLEGDAASLQLEKLPPEAVARIHQRLPGTRLAAAGGVNIANAEAYARAGARILVTSAPYFATPRDVAVTLTAAQPVTEP